MRRALILRSLMAGELMCWQCCLNTCLSSYNGHLTVGSCGARSVRSKVSWTCSADVCRTCRIVWCHNFIDFARSRAADRDVKKFDHVTPWCRTPVRHSPSGFSKYDALKTEGGGICQLILTQFLILARFRYIL